MYILIKIYLIKESLYMYKRNKFIPNFCKITYIYIESIS